MSTLLLFSKIWIFYEQLCDRSLQIRSSKSQVLPIKHFSKTLSTILSLMRWFPTLSSMLPFWRKIVRLLDRHSSSAFQNQMSWSWLLLTLSQRCTTTANRETSHTTRLKVIEYFAAQFFANLFIIHNQFEENGQEDKLVQNQMWILMHEIIRFHLDNSSGPAPSSLDEVYDVTATFRLPATAATSNAQSHVWYSAYKSLCLFPQECLIWTSDLSRILDLETNIHLSDSVVDVSCEIISRHPRTASLGNVGRSRCLSEYEASWHWSYIDKCNCNLLMSRLDERRHVESVSRGNQKKFIVNISMFLCPI